MKSKATLGSIFILFSVLLCSCGGNIPITGADSPPTDSAERQISQSSSDGSSVSTGLSETLACATPTASVKVNNAYMREGPDVRFESLAQYKKGVQVKVLGHYRDWFQAEAPDGKKGWLYKDWITIPSSMDTSTICSVTAEGLTSTPKNNQQNDQQNDQQNAEQGPLNSEDCVPTYYVTCP
jgi:uncharacterized protein YgiM (DUF1202 family)